MQYRGVKNKSVELEGSNFSWKLTKVGRPPWPVCIACYFQSFTSQRLNSLWGNSQDTVSQWSESSSSSLHTETGVDITLKQEPGEVWRSHTFFFNVLLTPNNSRWAELLLNNRWKTKQLKMYKAFILRANRKTKYWIFKVLEFLFLPPQLPKFVCFERETIYLYTWPAEEEEEGKESHWCINNVVINLFALQRNTILSAI